MAPDTEWLDQDEMAAWVNLITLASRIVALSDTELRRTRAITGRDYELMHHLSTSPTGLRVNELADVINDSSSCITHRINRLQRAGLVDKEPDPDDQRARQVVLNDAGLALLCAAAPEHVARVRRWVIDPLDRADLLHLARIASVVNQHLRSVAAPPS